MVSWDSVIAYRGSIKESDLKDLKVHLNIPSFLGGRAQLAAGEVKEGQTIASVRIQVERTIQKLQKFKVIRKGMPLIQTWTVCCLLCNFLPPLIKT